MIRIFASSFALLVAFGGAVSAQVTGSIDQDRPLLRSEAVVTGDVVRIGDLVDHAGIVAKVPIFRAPDPGSTGTVPVDAVLDAVRQHALIGLDTGGISEVTVTRLGRPIAAKEIEASIAQALAAQYGLGPTDDISLIFDRELRTINVEPTAKGGVRVDTLSYDARSGRFDATLDIPTGATNRGRLRVGGRAAVTVETVMPARTISRGEIIKHDDLVVQRRPRIDANNTIVTDIKQAVGLAARATLQADRPLRASDLMKPDTIQRNEQVTLIFEVPGITLTVRGKALEGGAEGDVISVLNEQTKRPVQGLVAGTGRVIVGGTQRLAANNQSIRAP